MRKLGIIHIYINTVIFSLCASPAYDKPFKDSQPNGDSITIMFCGDEYCSWYENSSRQVIVRNNIGAWVYANAENGKITPSSFLVSDTVEYTIDYNSNLAIRRALATQRREKLEYEKHLENTSKNTLTNSPNRVIVFDKAEVPLPTSGNPKILVILMQFSDVKFQDPTNANAFYSDLFQATTLPTSACPLNSISVKKFWKEASYNKFAPEATIVGPYTAKKSRSYYGNGQMGKYSRELVEEAIDLATNDVNMADFDNNNDNWVEGIVVIYAGRGYDLEIKNDPDRDEYIWPHQGYINYKYVAGVKVSKYCMIAELYSNSRRGSGTICH